MKHPTKACATAIARLKQSARLKNNDLVALIGGMQEKVSSRVSDPDDPERAREHIRPDLQKNVLNPLALEGFQDSLEQFENEDFAQLALTQESLRRSIATALLSLRDTFHAVVPPEKAAPPPVVDPRPTPDPVDPDRKPGAIADWLEKHGEWLDIRLGDPEVRKSLVKRLRAMDEFHPKYWRVQSMYLKYLGQGFRPKSREIVLEEEKE
ncbi:hypothetical protein ACFL01_02490 [Planctomycetota bacterium]